MFKVLWLVSELRILFSLSIIIIIIIIIIIFSS